MKKGLEKNRDRAWKRLQQLSGGKIKLRQKDCHARMAYQASTNIVTAGHRLDPSGMTIFFLDSGLVLSVWHLSLLLQEYEV